MLNYYQMPTLVGGESTDQTTQDSGLYNSPSLNMFLASKQADMDRAKLFIDRINSIKLPGMNPMQGIPAQYTRQQGGQQMGGLQPMQMYQNRNQYQNQMGDSMQPMQMLNQYRQTGQAPGMSAGSTPAGGK